MRIVSLRIRNFRAIENFEATVEDFIVIAGPNGCGKTTVLDALRLVKSIYVANEYNKWFSEFGIDLNRPHNFSTIFRDTKRPIEIETEFLLSEREAGFLSDHAYNIALGIVLTEDSSLSGWRKGFSTISGDRPILPPNISSDTLRYIESKAGNFAEKIKSSLDSSLMFKAGVTMIAEPQLCPIESVVAQAAFSCFRPDQLGEMEFHSSRRLYSRDTVSNIRLNVGDRSQERRNRFLFDIENKYKDIKTQLGEEYISALLKRENPNEAPLQGSIKELFKTFFPSKEFLGIQVTGDNSMIFPVRLNTGEIHDIDELSSGEKEIVYGYLWLRTGTPRSSIVLIDEPELHLNPALVQGLPNFYKIHLADALDSQVWIVTHSDAILRQAVRAPKMTVYHMARASGDGSKQAIRIDDQDAVEVAVIDLIGELAAYRPYAKIVLVEGHKETRFDVDMIRRLFPDMAEKGNFLPVGNRKMTTGVRVRLLEVLSEAGLTGRAVSISDGDLGITATPTETAESHFIWPVYEIENFLLMPNVLRCAAKALLRTCPFAKDEEIVKCLRSLSENLIEELARDEVQYALNEQFVTAISIGGSKKGAANDLRKSAESSQRRIAAINVTKEKVDRLFVDASTRLCSYLDSDEFLVRFPGDRLLRAFAGYLQINGDVFRNACLDQAQRLGLRPQGMEQTLRDALA